MKKSFLLLLSIFSIARLNAQGSLTSNGNIYIKTSAGVYMILDDTHLINNGSLFQELGDGIIKFSGNADVNISGNHITTIDRLVISKGNQSNLNLQINVNIVSEVNFQGGLLNLGSYGLNLGHTGILLNESENSRAYSIANGGYISANRLLNIPSSVNIGNLGAIISSEKNLGRTVINRRHAITPNVYGASNSIRRSYEILPENNIALKATLRLLYFDAELNGIDESNLVQWKKKIQSGWDYVGADSRNLSTNYVERKNISKFASWTLAKDTVTTMNRLYTIPQPEVKKIEFSITVMPNPAINSFFVFVKSGNDTEKITMNTFDLSGKLIEAKSNINSGEVFTIGRNYQPGAFLIEIIQGNTRKVVKLLKL